MIVSVQRAATLAALSMVAAGCEPPGSSPAPAEKTGSAAPPTAPDASPRAPAPAASEPGLVAHFSFDEGSGSHTRELSSERDVAITGPRPPEWTTGPAGSALRLDGFTRWVELESGVLPDVGGDAITVEGWLALEAYPVSNAPLVNRYTFPTHGYFLGVEPLGRWYFAVAIDGEWHTVFAPEPLPKQRWVHVAGTFDEDEGLTLFLDGERVAQQNTPGRPFQPEDSLPVMIGRDLHTPRIGAEFPTGLLDALVDEIRIYDRALSPATIRSHHASLAPPPPADLTVPTRRHAGDPHRPQIHALPRTAWTNEPHGLLRIGDHYHLFFQQNPSGPYWARIHWGHLTSPDLVHWTPRRPALAPEPGIDQAGTWSGNAVIDREGVPTLVYTAVDGARATVALAQSRDGGLTFDKHLDNPVIDGTPEGYEDFRDPFAWRQGDDWYLLIGSGIPDGGGVVLAYRSPDLRSWRFLGPAFSGERATSGRFWEMPMLLPLGDDRHVLLVTTVEPDAPPRTLYWVGSFEDGRFTPSHDTPRRQDPLHSVLSPTITEAEGRWVGLGIVPEARSSRQQANAGWAHTFSLPRVYGLSEDGRRLTQAPLPELESLRAAKLAEHTDVVVRPDAALELTLGSDPAELAIDLETFDAEAVTLALARSADGEEETRITFDFLGSRVRVDRTDSSLDAAVTRDVREGPLELVPGEPLRLRAFVDRSILEIFVNDEAAFATRVYPTRPDSRGAALRVEEGSVHLRSLRAWRLAP